jgi:Zinc carboxypeptidase
MSVRTGVAALASTLALAACVRGASMASPSASSTTPANDAAVARGAAAVAGAQVATSHRVASIASRRFGHDVLWNALAPSTGATPGGTLRVREIGRSMQGRPLRAVTWGRGPTTVLLWSQMHGDESTATMALADLLAWMSSGAPAAPALRERLAASLTVVMVPMLNPDGAELFQRENAAGIDVNRDARRLATPEARALEALRDSIRPAFGFNLHDQGARTLVGPGGPPAAIALLAPAAEESRAWGPVRATAREIAAEVAAVLAREIPGRVAKYNDAHEPRAFGDLMQRWGTSTVLIESGSLPDDPEKQRLRALNVVAIVTALDAIATGRHRGADVRPYESLPTNSGGAVDVLVRGGWLVLPGQAPMRADLALNYEEPVARLRPRLRDVGDLAAATAIDTVEAEGLYVHPAASMLTERGGARWLRLGAPAALTLRSGAEVGSAVVRVIGEER